MADLFQATNITIGLENSGYLIISSTEPIYILAPAHHCSWSCYNMEGFVALCEKIFQACPARFWPPAENWSLLHAENEKAAGSRYPQRFGPVLHSGNNRQREENLRLLPRNAGLSHTHWRESSVISQAEKSFRAFSAAHHVKTVRKWGGVGLGRSYYWKKTQKTHKFPHCIQEE